MQFSGAVGQHTVSQAIQQLNIYFRCLLTTIRCSRHLYWAKRDLPSKSTINKNDRSPLYFGACREKSLSANAAWPTTIVQYS